VKLDSEAVRLNPSFGKATSSKFGGGGPGFFGGVPGVTVDSQRNVYGQFLIKVKPIIE